jgi:Fe2+ transport system protein FeoA
LSLLSELEAGGDAILEALDLPPAVSNHLMYMGFVPDARVRMLRRAPAGDPTVYAVDGIEVALRQETARSIRVRPVGSAKDCQLCRDEELLKSKQAAGAD